jgi:hypothetical protein
VPANSSIPITLKYRGVSDFHGRNAIDVYVLAPNDASALNNHTVVYYEVGQPTDLAIAAASASVTGTVGTAFNFPRITITNGNATAFQPEFEFSVPDFVSVANISAAGAVCSGTSLLRCDFPSLPAGGSIIIDISLNALAVGSQSPSVRVTSASDNHVDNDAIAIDVRVDAAGASPPPQPPPVTPPSSGGSSGGGGGGGGGSLEWPALLALGALVGVRHSRRRPHPGRSRLCRAQNRCGLRH